jgi:hypothetical protein
MHYGKDDSNYFETSKNNFENYSVPESGIIINY